MPNFDFQVAYENKNVLSHSHLIQIRRGLIAAPRRNCFNLFCFELPKLSCKTKTACWIDVSSGDTYSDISLGNHPPVTETLSFYFIFEWRKDRNLVPQMFGFYAMPQVTKSDKDGIHTLKTEVVPANMFDFFFFNSSSWRQEFTVNSQRLGYCVLIFWVKNLSSSTLWLYDNGKLLNHSVQLPNR